MCLTPFSTMLQLYRGSDAVFFLVQETAALNDNHRPVTDKLYHIMLYRIHLAMREL